MIKPRYSHISESVSDFNRMLDGMNKIQPLEKNAADDIHEMFVIEQGLVRLEQQIEHVTNAINGSGMQISLAEAQGLAQMHAHAAAVYGSAADKALGREQFARRSGNSALASKMADIHQRLRRMAKDHTAKVKEHQRNVEKVNNEAVQQRESYTLMDKMRMLAGLVETVQMPRDPGLMGTTRRNDSYVEMAKPFELTEKRTKVQQKAGLVAKDMRGEGLPLSLGRNVSVDALRDRAQEVDKFQAKDVRDPSNSGYKSVKSRNVGPGRGLSNTDMDNVKTLHAIRTANAKAQAKKLPGAKKDESLARQLQLAGYTDAFIEARTKAQQDAGQAAMAQREVDRAWDPLAVKLGFSAKAPKSKKQDKRRQEVRAAMDVRGSGDRLAERPRKYFTRRGGSWDARSIDNRRQALLDRARKRKAGIDPGGDDIG